MVDRDRGLRRVWIPLQRSAYEFPHRPLSEKELNFFLPTGTYDFMRIRLPHSNIRVREIGIHGSGERVEVFDFSKDDRGVLRGVLTGYQGIFGNIYNKDIITIDVVGLLEEGKIATKFYTDMPSLDVERYVQAAAYRR